MEALEPRLLLTADPFYSAESQPEHFDLTLRIEDGARLTLLDTATSETVASTTLAEITGPVRIVGSNYDDWLRLDLSPTFVAASLPL